MTELLKSSNPLEVSTEELRVNLADYLSQVRYADRVVVVKKYNRDAAIILSPRMLERIVKSVRASEDERRQALQELESLVNRIPPAKDDEQLQQDIDQAVREVRAAKRKGR
jgi:PHD/YefM family antitoxin component YafN of YafNO toxin-antitoxin module